MRPGMNTEPGALGGGGDSLSFARQRHFFVFGNGLFTIDRGYSPGYFSLESISTPTLQYQYQYFADGRVKQITGVEEPEFTRAGQNM
jgi:hypothetical protein